MTVQLHAYPTDLTDAQWQHLQLVVRKASPKGRRLKHPRRSIVNAVLYIVRSGCAWRLLPKSFPPWQTVYGYFRQWTRSGLWQQIHDQLRDQVRRQVGKTPAPTAAILDSQSVKIGDQAGLRGFDKAKLISGRKRHLLVDTLGLILGVLVSGASLQDYDGAKQLLVPLVFALGWLQIIWADAGYDKEHLRVFVKGLRPHGKLHLDIVKKPKDQVGFQVQRKRWIVERTFGWLMKSRRLVRDYECKTEHAEAMIHICMIGVMLRRLESAHRK